SPSKPSLLLPAGIAFGASALGIGIGAVTGVMSLSQLSDIRTLCRSDGHCAASLRPRAEAAYGLGDASAAAFVIGGAAAAAGFVMLVLHVRSRTPDAPAIRPEVGFGWVGVRGGF